MKTLRIIAISCIIILVALFFYLTSGTDPQELLLHTVEEWQSHHILVILFIFILTILSTAAGLPVLYLGVALGFFMAYFPALVAAWIMNLLAVMLTFWMVRRLFFSYFREKYSQKKLIRRTNKRIRKYGLWTVAFTRSIYIIPTNIINFSFPLSKIKPRTYLFGTMVGLIPECFINVSTGYMIRHELILLTSPQQNLLKIVAVGMFILAMSGIFIFLKIRKKQLKKTKIEKIVPLLKEE